MPTANFVQITRKAHRYSRKPYSETDTSLICVTVTLTISSVILSGTFNYSIYGKLSGGGHAGKKLLSF